MAVVWASNAMINPAMLRSLNHNFGDDRLDYTAQCQRDNNSGKPMAPECFPSEIFVRKDSNTNYEKLPCLFYAFGYWVVSDKVANVLRRFELGAANIYPVRVYRKDRKTPIGNSWFCLNFGNVKSAVIPEQSTHIRPLGPSKTYWLPDELENNSVAVHKMALDDPDIWIDAIFGNTFFVSDRLAMALKAEGVAGPFGLKKCRVI